MYRSPPDPRARQALPLTTSQRLMWTGQQLYPDAPLYNMAHRFDLLGEIDPARFQRAFQHALDHTDVLRTVVAPDEADAPVARVRAPYPYVVETVDLRHEPDPEAAARRWIEARVAVPLDLAVSAFDAALLLLSDRRTAWYLCQHHLIADIWSVGLVYERVAAAYEALDREGSPPAPTFPQFSAYVAHEQAQRADAGFAATRSFWDARRAALPPPTALYGHPTEGETTPTVRERHRLGEARSARLRDLAAQPAFRAISPHLSFYGLIATTLLAFMHRVSGQSRLVLGTPAHDRRTRAFKETAGLFMEVVPLHVDLAPDETFATLFRTVQTETTTLLRHVRPGVSDAATNRSYNVLLNYIPVTFGPFAGRPMRSTWVHAGHGDAHHHLRLQVHDFEAGGDFTLEFDFNADHFDQAARDAAVRHFFALLDAFLDDPSRPIAAPSMLSEDEQARILARAQPPPQDYPVPPTVLDAILRQGARTPDATAVSAEPRRPDLGPALTYAALLDRADAIAQRLRAEGVRRGAFVAVLLDRSVTALAALLGVWKAGAAYVPLDAAHPRERLAAVLRDLEPAAVLTTTALAGTLEGLAARVVRVDAAGTSTPDASPPDLAPPEPGDPAYVLYTSGSTGTPKGVVVEHQQLAHYVAWARSYYVDGEAASFPWFTPLVFDLTVTSLFVPLTVGGAVVVYAGDGVQAAALGRVVEDDVVDVVKLTPSHLALIQPTAESARASVGEGPARRLRALILGGENLRADQVRHARRALGPVAVYNEYGPTEATVGCAVYRYDPLRDTAGSVPIGGPAAQARLYVLDGAGHLVPDGVPGELYVGGPGVARGYLRLAARTRARFVPDPFAGDASARMYRTGDQARRRPDGTLEYLGRQDGQVKVRGTRIELGAVEAALARVPGVSACAAAVVERAAASEEVVRCVRCGLPSNHPDARYDAEGVCTLCRGYDRIRGEAARYFGTMDDLRARFEGLRRAHPDAPYDGLLLLSGGKDSTYALARLVDMGLRVLTFTLDNGYLSDEAMANIRRVTDALGVEHVVGTTPAMNAIFADSLARYSNVCNGCFKTIYTLAFQLALERGIPAIVTGLSRGQFFETRLTEELFEQTEDPDRIDLVVLEARKAYHRADDAVSRLLDTRVFQQDAPFDAVEFVDFYRYCDVGLADMMAYLDARLPWERPSDTGRSTNCLINEAGIFVHTRERGFHNYAFPYSWDVRVGHKERGAAIAELEDDIDEARVRRMLREVGYEMDERAAPAERQLAAYYVSERPLAPAALREALAETLPAAAVPTSFVRVDALPLTRNGKVDRAALPAPDARPDPASAFVAPETPTQERVAAIWRAVLHRPHVGIRDAFLDLGGTSLSAIQIMTRLNAAFGLALALPDVFEASTVEAQAELVEAAILAEIDALSEEEAARLVRP